MWHCIARAEAAFQVDQLVLFKSHGGKRRGAGRPPKGKRAGAPHKERQVLEGDAVGMRP